MPVWALVLIIIFGSIFGIFLLLGLIALIKKPSSIYKNKPEERNPMEGKMVEFVYDDNDKENADGVKGHLIAVGEAKPKRKVYFFFKRLLDIILSFGALFILSPLFLVLIIAILIDNPGPVLFTQKRLGKNKRYFKLHKFRSMKMSTPHDVPTHMLENPEQYITKVGKFIRAHSLDELPQIWDILMNRLAIVGPRSPLPKEVENYNDYQKHRLDVKGGLLCLWQIQKNRHNLSFDDWVDLDIKYVEKRNLWLDFKIIIIGAVRVIFDHSGE